MLFTPLNKIVIFFTQLRLKRMKRDLLNPIEIQQSLLKSLIKSGKTTVFGKKHKFKKIKNYNHFKANVPIREYESMSPFIQKTRKGKQNVIWPTMIKWFSKSSGTTDDKSKFIPVSFESLDENHMRSGKDALSWYCEQFPDSVIFAGKSLRLGGYTTANNINHESYFGDISAIIVENLPLWAEIRSTPNQRISLMPEWETKIEAIAEATINKDVTCLVGVPSWMLVLIRRVLKKTGAKELKEVWPNLELYIHGGVSFTPYRAEFEKLMGKGKIEYLETYNATEGFFAVQDCFPSKGLLLMVNHAIFYEFIAMDNFNGEDSTAIPLSDVKLGVTYAMVITTKSGLWRYSIGDTIKFVSLNPHRIEIVGRTKHFINAFGEELMIDNAANALAKACEKTGATIKDYSAAPIYMDDNNSGAHQWMIEFIEAPKSLQEFTEILDSTLQEVNTDYQAKRHKNMALGFPVVQVAKANLFFNWLKSKGKLGGQNKVPRLSNNRVIMDELLALNAK